MSDNPKSLLRTIDAERNVDDPRAAVSLEPEPASARPRVDPLGPARAVVLAVKIAFGLWLVIALAVAAWFAL